MWSYRKADMVDGIQYWAVEDFFNAEPIEYFTSAHVANAVCVIRNAIGE